MGGLKVNRCLKLIGFLSISLALVPGLGYAKNPHPKPDPNPDPG